MVDLDTIYSMDKLVFRDENQNELIYQQTQDHMFLLTKTGARMLSAFEDPHSPREVCQQLGIPLSRLPAKSVDRLTSYLDGLVLRGLLVATKNEDSQRGGE